MIEYLTGDCRQVMNNMDMNSVDCIVTSPPYWGLRDYDVEGQMGLELTPEEYIANMVAVFQAAKRVLKKEGTLWLNLGDCYYNYRPGDKARQHSIASGKRGEPESKGKREHKVPGLKEKDLVGIPWRVALALQGAGWYLRSDIIWNKPNPMPESVKDRPTRCHEYIFLLAKNKNYYYDFENIMEACLTHEGRPAGVVREREWGYDSKRIKMSKPSGWDTSPGRHRSLRGRYDHPIDSDDESGEPIYPDVRNKRTVWTLKTEPYRGAHFAVFPPDLIRPCIIAGCPTGGTVLDPFAGSGTTALVAEQEGRNAILIDIKPEYVALQKERTSQASLLSPI